MTDAPDTTLWSIEQVAAYLDVASPTLARWRHRGSGPRFVKVGGKVKYRRSAVLSWVESREVLHTGEARSLAGGRVSAA